MSSIDKKPYSPKVVSIFSGCGGLDLGFHLEGYDTIWANDFAEWAVKSFEKNFGNVILCKDITQIDRNTYSIECTFTVPSINAKAESVKIELQNK